MGELFMKINFLSRRFKVLILYSTAFLALFIWLLPYFFMIMSAFKSRLQVYAYPPVWIFEPTMENFEQVIFGENLFFYLRNTLLIAIPNTILTLVISLPAAYSFARFRFVHKEKLFILLLFLQLVPGISVIIAYYYIATNLGLFDTHILLIILYLLWNIPFTIWIVRGFFEGIPVELEEAALIDGCTRLSALLRIVLPLSAPGVGAVALLLFIFSWNEFTLPYFLTALFARPLSTTVVFYMSHTEIFWGRIFALGSISTLPPIALALIIRRYFIRTLAFGALKG
jgi:multiple sugar transport system permease protein